MPMPRTFMLLLVIVLLAACRQAPEPEPSLYQQIHQRMAALQSYRARATVAFISNKGTNTYETVQHARITGEYRIEVNAPEHVAGSVTSFDGQHIYQFSSRVNGRVMILARECRERSEIFLTSFIKNWQAGQESSVSVANIEGGQHTILEASIPGDHPYLSKQRLHICNQSLLPIKMQILDPEGNERVIVTYHSFEYNIELEDAIFTV